jgi:DNA-directed RNA polymerase specialized sigma24 family protein
METPRTLAYADEQEILLAREMGDLSTEESFRALFDLHGRAVLGWLLVRAPRDQADDLFQEVWSTFYVRWRSWEFREHLKAPEARPVLSFLFRTAAFLRHGEFRRKRLLVDCEALNILPDAASGPEALDRQVQVRRCLDLAAEICSPEELDALLGKLSGLSGEEMAQTLRVTAAIADHRYRSAVARLKRHLQPQAKEVQP